jgi:hypothetical protein
MNDRYETRLGQMPELLVRAFLAYLEPSVRFQAPDHFTAIHVCTIHIVAKMATRISSDTHGRL